MNLLDRLENAAAAAGINATKDWQIRPTKCGRTRPLAATGGRRIAAAGRKYTLGWCRHCRWLRIAAIERVPPEAYS